MTERHTFNLYDPITGELRVVFQAGSHSEMVKTAKQLDPSGRLVFKSPEKARAQIRLSWQ